MSLPTLYRIRDVTTGRYVIGGAPPRFTQKGHGKIFVGDAALRGYMRQQKSICAALVIESYNMGMKTEHPAFHWHALTTKQETVAQGAIRLHGYAGEPQDVIVSQIGSFKPLADSHGTIILFSGGATISVKESPEQVRAALANIKK